MGIKMLIERLNELYRSLRLDGEQRCSPEINTVAFGLMDAATALSTLQAENEKLRGDVVRLSDLLASYQNVLVPELRAELEQVKRKRDAAVESIPHECKTCMYHMVFFNGCTLDHDCTNHDGGCSNNYDRWEWRGQKED